MKKSILLFLVLMFVITCSSESNIEEGIIINIGGEPETLDPTLNSESPTSTYLNHLFESLTRKDKNNKVVPGLAETYSISDDGLTYIFNLRTNAKWSDGKIITADDFVYSWRRAVDPKTAAEYAYMMEYIKNAKEITEGKLPVEDLGIKALNDNTLEVTLVNPTPYFLEFLSGMFITAPLREDIISQYGDSWTRDAKTYISNGPYVMVERKPDEKIILEINTNYWDKDNTIAPKITFLFMTDTAASIAAMKSDDLHLGLPPTGEVDKLREEGYIVDNHAFGSIYISLNMEDKVLSDKRIREALSLAVDRKYLVENIVKSDANISGAFVPHKINGLHSEFRDENPNYINIDEEYYKENILKAKELMAKAGYPNGEGFPVLDIKVTVGLYTLLAEALQNMWKENLGIDVKITTEEFPITLENLRNKNYEMARMGWTGDYNDPMTMLDIFLTHSAINFSGFDNEEYNNLINFAKSSPDKKARMEALYKAENILMEEMPIIPLYYRSDAIMVNPILKNYILDPLGRHNFRYSYIEI